MLGGVMNIHTCNYSVVLASPRAQGVANNAARFSRGRIPAQAINLAKRRRERILASLAFVMLILAWDATLRLDERVAPPRMRMSHAVEHESVEQILGSAP
jgi:hypothetical protein